MYYDYIASYTFESLMATALAEAPPDIDKRQGSIIYDALAPFAVVATNLYVDLKLYYENTNLLTAKGEALDAKVADFGLSRTQATYAVRKCTCVYDNENPFNIAIGSRFSTIVDSNPVFYTATSKVSDGVFLLTCETAGIIGNSYVGNLLPVTQISGLGRATLSDIITPAEDEEDDETLRERCLTWLRRKPYGGNVNHYRQWSLEYNGIGAVQVYPVWNGGGTVKLSILDSEYNICTQAFIDLVKEYFDPAEYTQQGLGVAPIGHNVTVVTPTEVNVAIAATVLLEDGYTLEQVQATVEEKIKGYLDDIKTNWGTPSVINTYSSAIYRALIIAKLLEAGHILNVTDCTINTVASDLVLTQTGAVQQIPKFVEVVLTNAT